MSLSAQIRNRYSAGSCLSCKHENNPKHVIEIALSNVLVRVCPDCAIELRNQLTNAISRMDNNLDYGGKV